MTGNALEMLGDDLTLIAYTADVGSQAEDQLRLLASWTATQAAAAHETHPCAVLSPARLIPPPDLVCPSPTSAATERNENHHA